MTAYSIRERLAGMSGTCADRRLALVAGGSGHLGSAIARELSRRGWRLGVHCHSRRQVADRVASGCDPPRGGEGAFVLEADLRSRAGADELLADFEAEAGEAPRLLVAAAGIVRDAPLLRTSAADWDETVAVNLSGPAWLLRAAAERWASSGGGHAILLGSYAGTAGREGGAAYSASKAALVGLARSVARELGPKGVRVNVVIPPFVAEGMGRAASPAFVEEARARSVLGSTGSAEDFARFVAALATTGAVSGQVLHADARIV